jgi:alpha-N-arabinofuranosidase
VAEDLSDPLPDGPVELVLQADRRDYHFSVVVAGAAPKLVGRHELRYLSTEVAGGYVGVVIGVYAGSRGQASGHRAFFDWFDYEPLG